jgi:hypothetical protein
VWPGKVHSQTWQIFWIGVLYLIGALLPWGGSNSTQFLVSSETGARTISAVVYQNEVAAHAMNSSRYAHPGEVVSSTPPSMGFGQVLLLLCSLAMVTMGAISIWNRRLAMTPTLATWFVALAALYFYKGWPTPDRVLDEVKPIGNGFGQFGNTLGAIFSNFGKFIRGESVTEVNAMFNGAGLGFYVTMVAQIMLTLIIILSLVTGGSNKPAPKKRR